jgi:DNA-binding transcriptional ArsR family regulator
MTRACQEVGLPAPVLEEIGTHFRVTLLATPTVPRRLDEKDQRILALLGAEDGRSTAQIARAVSLSVRATRTRLMRLVDRGLIVGVGSDPQDPRRQYLRATWESGAE